MFSFKGIGIKVFALIIGLVAIALGIYLTFFHSRGYLKTEAVILTVEEIPGTGDDGTEYQASVEYTVDGVTYQSELDSGSPSYKVGKTIPVLYNPEDPSMVHGAGYEGVYAMAVGAAILAVLAVSEVRGRKALGAVKAAQEAGGAMTYPETVPGPERKLYFLTDVGTPKYGHRIEDGSRSILYEAKMTRFSVMTPYGFDFVDHEHGTTVPHLVGHEEESDWGGGLLLDNHYTFTIDGEDIWKHLRRNGITVESSLNRRARTEYRILRNGTEIAMAETSSTNVHEEDEAQKSRLASIVPVQGFYRITTTETDLSLLFVTLLAFARSGASDDRGGNLKTVLGTLKKL